MAMLLKRDYELLSLRVGLRADVERTNVRCVLERGQRGDIVEIEQWTLSPEEFGLPERLGRRSLASGFHVPASLVSAIADAVRDQSTPDNVLWLHLQRPFGYLGMVPWEMLSAAINRPVLRLPDVLAPPLKEQPHVVDVALCASSPVATSQFQVVEAVAAFAEDAAAGMQRRLRIQAFVDADAYTHLSAMLQRPPSPNVEIIVHDPAAAAGYAIPDRDIDVPDRVTDVSSPWLQWIRDAVKNRSLDVVHFIGHGIVAQDRGALALAESPVRNEDRGAARFVGFAELSTFLTQVGAWSVAFTTPIENQSDAGVRLLADQLGLRRPGAVLHHSAAQDPHWHGLSQAYAFLYSSMPAVPPAHAAVAIYCQPSRVRRNERVELEGILAKTEANARLDEAFSQDEVPSWLAASQRYLEQCEYQSKQGGSTDWQVRSPQSSSSTDADTVRATLEQLQGVVARFAKPTGGVQ